MKRWYEMSADVCILVSMLELAQKQDRDRIAKKIIEELVDLGYQPDENLYEEYCNSYSMSRWYDTDKTVFLSIEYLKDATKEQQEAAISRISDYMRLKSA